MKQLSVITPTGARLEAFSLCHHFMMRQTLEREKWEWIIVDDGPQPIGPALLEIPNLSIIYVRPATLWEPSKNTLLRNLREGLARCTGEFIAFVEDDDWYHPDYLQRMLLKAQLEGYEVVGEAPARYYHLPTRRFKSLDNSNRASLCQTLIHNKHVPLLQSLLEGDTPFVDTPLWKSLPMEKKFIFPQSRYSVGIKGLPGREGTGCGHRPPFDWPTDDANLRMLREWVGADWMLYKHYCT